MQISTLIKMADNLVFPSRSDRSRFRYSPDNTVPKPTDLPELVWESFWRLRQARANQPETSATAESQLRSWVGTSCLDWQTRNHLAAALTKGLPSTSDSQERETLELLLALCRGWNDAEVRITRKSLRPLRKEDLWQFKVTELKALAGQLLRRGIGDRGVMRRLAIYTGSGVWKETAVNGIWEALNPPSATAEAELPPK